ncbi:unnamed protein product [Taenia asiatica]|uniref:Transmembrane protein n=1 Tax=Taenia asiatica TaxID=60517 RepID=A0A0R3WD85_TAEAS|nr:unnamed protein product [Taenia asiatica]
MAAPPMGLTAELPKGGVTIKTVVEVIDRYRPEFDESLALRLLNQWQTITDLFISTHNSIDYSEWFALDYSAEFTACAAHLMTPQWQVICLLLIWSLLTVLGAGMCCASCLLPFWIAGSVDLPASGGRIISSVSHLGLFRRCGYPTYESNGDVVWMQGCGYYPTMENAPH